MSYFFHFTDQNITFLKAQLKDKTLFWDSSFIIQLLDERNVNPTIACKALYAAITEEKMNIINLSCDFVIEEAIHKIIYTYYNGLIKKLNTPEANYEVWTKLYKEKPELIQNTLPLIGKLYNILDRAPVYIHRPKPEIELKEDALNLIQSANMDAMDAFIVATIQDIGAEDFITLDSDMIRIMDTQKINIYSCYRPPEVTAIKTAVK